MNVFKLIDLFSSEFLKNNKFLVCIFFIITIIYFSIEVVGISYIINCVLKKPTLRVIIYSVILFISLCLFNYFKGLLENWMSMKIRESSRIKLLNGIIDRFNESYKDIKIGDTISRIMSTTLEYSFAFNLFIKTIFPRFLIMFICCVTIFFIDKYLSGIFILSSLSLLAVSFFTLEMISRSKDKLEKTYYREFDDLSNKYNNLLNSYINNENNNEKNRLINQQKKYSQILLKSDSSLNNNTSILKAVLSFFLILIIVYIFYYHRSIKNDSKSFLGIIIIFYISAALTYSADSSDFFSHLGICQSSYQQFSDLLKRKPTGPIKNIRKGDISISNLFFSYHQNSPILENINLNIPYKQKIAIMGRSGSGKSTLAKIILKLYPYQGVIKINNIDIQKIDTFVLREKISYVNQRTELLEKSVLENIRFGSNSSPNEVMTILEKYQLQEVFSGLKKGVYEQCLIDGKNLSLGMQKVIILVRGILKSKNSLVVFFDEPLAALDQKTRKKIIKMIMTECSNKTIIVITHDPEIVPYMDGVYNINHQMNS